MIESAAVLMRERGVEKTSFSEVLAHSGAPRGSIYHHFPGGKAELVDEATRYAGEFTAAAFAAALAEDDPIAAIHGFSAMWLRILERSDFSAGCPVVAAALSGGSQDTAAGAFRSWERALEEALAGRGVELTRAGAIATLVIAAIEGAVVLARAERSAGPLERVASELEHVISEAVS